MMNEFQQVKKKHELQMNLPCAIPESDRWLENLEDAEGNQIYRLTCMKDQTYDYIRVMKKNGFVC